MSKVIETKLYKSAAKNTPINFEHDTPPGPYWGYSRYLTLDGERAYELSFPCDTCQFIFERQGGATKSIAIEKLRKSLRGGITRLDDNLLKTAGSVLPAGEYIACLLEIVPALVRPFGENDYFSHEQVKLWPDSFWGLPHYPKTEYYRTMTLDIGEKRAFFEFIVPMIPTKWLEEEGWKLYTEEISSGQQPTALAISVLDIKQPADWEGDPPITKHWCLAHFLLDGHHKTYSASLVNKPITLLSFLAVSESISKQSDLDLAVKILQGRENLIEG